MLYTLLRSYRIQESISLLYWLVTREASNDGIRTLQNPAVSVVLTSFARFMALYFINEEVFVYSFLCPRHFPRLHHCRSYNKNTSRKLPLCYQTLFKNLNNHQFARHWTPDVTVSLFLITGNIEEASNFALQLGDWKTAIVLHYASQTCGKRLRMKKKIQTLLTTQLCNLVDWICDIDDDQDCFTPSMITTLKDWLLAGAFCDVDVVPTVLSHLIRKLDLLIRHLPLFVSPGIHLPSPPPYCPHFSEHDNMSMDSEESCRKGITRMVQLFLTVLRIINCDIPVIHSYLSYLQNVIFKMSSVKGRSINLDWPLQNIYNKLINYANVKQHQKLDDDQLTRLVSYFRDMCTICWFLHTRDNVNQHLRKLWQNQQDHFVISYPAQFCLEALQWASHLAPFSSDVGWGLEVYHLIVSLLLEAPQDRRASHVLARCFPDGNPIPADIDYRIRRLAESWRGITVKVPSCRKQSRSSRTLFLIYQEQREEVNATQNRLKETFGDFEPVSQMSSNLSSQMQKVKSFETEKDYLVFLALMLDVGIIKDRLEEESPDIPIPILNKFRYQLAQIHQNVFVSKDISDERKRLALRRIHVDAENLVGSSFPEKQSTDSDEVCSHLVKRKLFRSTSLDEVQLESRRLTNWSLPLRNVPLKAEKRTQSLTALSNDLPERKHKGITKNFSSTIHPKHSSLLSLCEAMDLRTSFNKLSNDKTDDEEMANTLAWLLRWAKDEHDLKYVRDGRGTPTVKLSVTLRQLLWAVRQRKMPAFSQELNVSRSLSDIHTDSPGLSIENFPQIDIRVTRRHQMNKFERRRRQGVTLFEDSTDFNNLRRLESTDRSNWILKSRQESKEKNSSCTIDATSFTMDRSLEELEVAANKVTKTDNSIEYSTSTTEQTRNEQRHIAFVKLNSHGSKHIVDTSRPVVDDALLLSKNKTTENPQNGVCTLNERSKAVWEDSKRNGTASPIEDESVEVTTTSKWTDDSQSLFIPCESGPENRISAYFLKYANDKETSELDSTLTSTSTNEFLPHQIRNPILKDASVQANENDNMKGVLKSPTVESSIVLARPIDTTTFLFMKDATSSSNVRTWTSRSATDMWTQTESQSEQDVLSDKVDEPDWQQSKFLRLPAEKEMCARCEPSTNVHLNRDQPPVIINEKPVSQPRIPTLLKLDQSPRFNRVSVPPFQEESQTRRKLLTLREVLDLRDKLVVRTGDEKKHQSLQGRSRGPMIPTLLRNRLQTHSLTAPEKWRNGFVNVDESGGSTLIDLSSRQKPRPNIVNGEKRKSKITPPLTKCCSCQTVETAHNDVSTLTDARVVQDTATETCLESPKIMVSFGMNTIEGETKEDDNVKINNSITQKEVIYRSLLGNVACGTQTDDNDEEIQTRDVGTNPGWYNNYNL